MLGHAVAIATCFVDVRDSGPQFCETALVVELLANRDRAVQRMLRFRDVTRFELRLRTLE